jgi:outer membrane protein OmpA-like peptidoglycan-associated protein
MKLRCLVYVIFSVALVAGSRALAETGKFNTHLELGPGLALNRWQSQVLGPGAGGALGFEFSLASLAGIEARVGHLQFFSTFHPEGYRPVEDPYLFSFGIGGRFRPLNDEKGYRWPWRERPDHTGNLFGNFWIDLHGNYFLTGGLHRVGADLGTGVELSVVDGLQMGPFARALYVFQPNSVNERASKDAWLLIAGLSFSLAIPPRGMIIRDTDGDGIYDPSDKCPEVPEDADKFRDEDGCPDADDDNDGILDIKDACRFDAEDFDGFEDQDGCPDKDNDLDGIADEADRCPDVPEDFDKFEDEDGCVDEDNDGDGLADAADKCPNEPETMNKYEDEDGCPDIFDDDKDKDGIPDDVDKCPDEPETVNGVEDDDGCPDKGLVEVKGGQILMGDRIFFDRNMARIKSQAKPTIDQLARLIKSHPEYKLIAIEGHADHSGNKAFNMKLSRRRAKRVWRYLVGKGVKPERLEILGYGESRPLLEGDPEERSMNRRVEVVIKSLDPSKRTAKSTVDAVAAAKRQARDTEISGGDDGEGRGEGGEDTPPAENPPSPEAVSHE